MECALLLCVVMRTLAFSEIRDLKTKTSVVNHLRIDLDLEEILHHSHSFIQASDSDDPFDVIVRMDLAKRVYELGGHACTSADISLPELNSSLNAGVYVFQSRPNDWARSALVRQATPLGSTDVIVEYTSLWRPCFGGGSSETTTLGAYGVKLNLSAHCLDTESAIRTDSEVLGVPLAVSHHFQSLAAFSVTAEARMSGETEFELRRAFHGRGDYAHQFISYTFDGNTGEALPLTDSIGFSRDLMKKFIVFMSVWMEVVHQLEMAVGLCEDADEEDASPEECTGITCEVSPIHAWEKAAAYYAGSYWNSPTSSILLDGSANEVCRDFGTCDSDGVANVNKQIFQHFKQGQSFLIAGNCADLVGEKEKIIQQMHLPIVQNLLKTAFALSTERDIRRDRAHGIFFATTIEPALQRCDPSLSDLLRENILVDAVSRPMAMEYREFKSAIEAVYPCLGIVCQEVGGILLPQSERDANSIYVEGAEPCGLPVRTPAPTPAPTPASVDLQQPQGDASSEDLPLGTVLAIIIASFVLCLISVGAACYCGFRKGENYQRLKQQKSERAPTPITLGLPNDAIATPALEGSVPNNV